MNFQLLTGNKREIWQSVSGYARELCSKTLPQMGACLLGLVVAKSRQTITKRWNDSENAPFKFCAICFMNLLPILLRKVNVVTIPLQFQILSYYEYFKNLDSIVHMFCGFFMLLYSMDKTQWHPWIKNVAIIVYVLTWIGWPDLESESEKEFARSKYQRQLKAQEKETIKNLKRMLKTKDPIQQRRIRFAVERAEKRFESHAEITKKFTKWEFAKDIILSQCSHPKAKRFLTSAMLCVVTVVHTDNSVSAISSIMQFVNSEFSSNQGMIADLWNMLMTINGTEEVPVEDYEKLKSHSIKGDLITNIQTYQSNWDLFKNSPAFGKMHRFMCAIVAMGLLEGREYDFSMGNIELFAMDTRQKSMSAIDALDAIIQMMTYLVESGAYAFQSNSLKPFLFDNKLAAEIDHDFSCYGPMLDHVVTGNLQLIYNLSEKELESKLTDLMEKIRRAMETTKGLPYTILQRKKETVARWIDRVIDARIACGTREAPYSPVLIGDSNIGKTTLTQIFAREIGARQGFNTSARYQSVIQGNDKFWTSYKGYTEVVILDDFGNTVTDFMTEDEGTKQIMIKNNQVCYAPKAGVEEKGRVPVQPKLMLINTNNQTMLSELSVCPYSRYRRGDVYIRASVKPEFARELQTPGQTPVYANEVDDVKVQAHFGKTDEDGNFTLTYPTLPNMWNITLQKPYVREAEPDPQEISGYGKRAVKPLQHIGWKTLEYDFEDAGTKLCQNLDIMEALDAVCGFASKFYRSQKSIVEMNVRMDADYSACTCGCKKSVAYCTAVRQNKQAFIDDLKQFVEEEKLVSHGVFEYSASLLATYIWKYSFQLVADFQRQLFDIEYTITEYATKYLVQNYNQLYKDAMFELITWIPFKLDSDLWYHKKFIDLMFGRELKSRCLLKLRWRVFFPVIVAFLSTVCVRLYGHYYMYVIFSWGSLYTLFVALSTYTNLVSIARKELEDELSKRVDSLTPLAKETREQYGRKLAAGVAGVAAVIVAIKVICKLREFATKNDSASLLRPISIDDITARNNLPNEWAGSTVTQSYEKGTATIEQLATQASKNLFFHTVEGSTEKATSLCTVLCNGVAAIPKHNLVDGWCKMRMFRDKWYVDIPLDAGNTYLCPNKDVALIYSAKIQGRDLTRHIRSEDTNTSFARLFSSPMKLVSLKKDSTVVAEQDLAANWYSCIKATEGEFPGWRYMMKEQSYHGLCGAALIIRDQSKPIFGGIHLAGNEVSGAGASICQADLAAFRAYVKHLPDISDQGNFPTAIVGDSEAVQKGTQPHESSPLLWSEGDHHYSYIGQCKGKASFYSSVRPSLITKTVEKYTGIPNNFGAPRAKPWWRPYHLDLEKRSNQPIGFGIGELREAASEYVSSLHGAFMSSSRDVRDYFVKKPLTRQQVLFGIDGYRFIDRMKFSTAIGFPYTGAKKKFCVLEGEDIVDFEPWVWEEVEKVRDVLRSTRRAYQVFKTSLKDEITKQFKEDGEENKKVRVFTCAPITLQILIRMYYLPVASIMSHFPLVSEQAVGINASGPDFHELISYIKENGDKTGYVAGDFSKYDLGMSADAILAAFKVMRDFAQNALQYTDDDILMMDMIANEVANPVIAYNGDMIQMTGSNPSGQNMTVYINGIVNSLYHRCVFNRLQKEHGFPGTFTSECRATFYGDDSLFAPSEHVAKYVHFNSLARVFKDVGIGYTPANKSESAPDLIPITEIDFLKRKPIYNPDLGAYMGALDFGSMVKSLHCSASDTLPPDVAASVNLDGSIREMFNHGKAEYDKWQLIVSDIAKEHNLTENINNLGVTYEQYLASYRAKYLETETDSEFA